MGKSITPKELKQRMDTTDGAVILDVRAAQAFAEWHIEGHGAKTVNIQNSKLIEFGVESFAEIPKDREVIAVCGKGNSAKQTVQMLEESGYQPILLEGGMRAWSEFYESVLVAQTDTFSIHQVMRPAKGCLSYLIASAGEAVVVDAGRHIQTYIDLAQELGVSIRHVFDTHLHADHVSGGAALAHVVGATYWIAPSEIESTVEGDGADRKNTTAGMLENSGDLKARYTPLPDRHKVPFGSTELSFISMYTPGHTIASTSFLLDGKYLFSGDTVFVSGLGRPDLKGKAHEMALHLYDTVFTRLNDLPEDTLILPGHYSDGREVNKNGFIGDTWGNIRRANPLLQMTDREQFIQTVIERAGATPPNYHQVIRVNRGTLELSPEEQTELEIGPNRCAVKHG